MTTSIPNYVQTKLGPRRTEKWLRTRLGTLGLLLQAPESKKKSLTSPKRRIIAHRTGAGGVAEKENQIATGEKAVAAGASIEGDVVQLRDGTIVVHHDLTGARIAGDSRRLAEINFSEVQEWKIDVPTLRDFLLAFRSVDISLDVKFDRESPFESQVRLVDSTIEEIRKSGIEERVTLASLESWRGALLIRSRGYRGPTALSRPELYLLYLAPWAYKRIPQSGDVAQIPIGTAKQLGRRFFQICQRYDLRSHVWGVEDARTAKMLFDMGSDLVETDHPERVLAGLSALGLD